MTDDPLAALVLAIERADMKHESICYQCGESIDDINMPTTIAESISHQLSLLGFTIRKKDK
jgi:hypothetical protein